MAEANTRQILPTEIHCQNGNKNKIITWTCFLPPCSSSPSPLFALLTPYACLSFPLAVLSFGRCSNGFWHAINIAFQISCLRFPWLQPIFNLLMELNLASLLQRFGRTVRVMNDTLFFFPACQRFAIYVHIQNTMNWAERSEVRQGKGMALDVMKSDEILYTQNINYGYDMSEEERGGYGYPNIISSYWTDGQRDKDEIHSEEIEETALSIVNTVQNSEKSALKWAGRTTTHTHMLLH